MDNKIFRDISYGMYLVTATDERKVGCIINTLTQVTSKNPIVSICLNKENYTNEIIKKTKKFAVNILSSEIDKNIIATFGFKSSKDTDKFKDLAYELKDNLAILEKGICGYLICEVIDVIDVETHDIFLARVVSSAKTSDIMPITYKYYHEVIKGSSPKKAPTYIEEEPETSSSTETWVCSVCGYAHQGPIDDNFVCPICSADRKMFTLKG